MLSSLLAVAILAAAPEDRWPAFRGAGDSVSAASDLPLSWSKEKGIAWSIELPGYGQSSPVVWKDRVFLTSALGEEKESVAVVCVELSSGKILWQTDFKSSNPAKRSDYSSCAAPTPAVDAERVYALFESGDLVAVNHDGTIAWQRSLVGDYGKFLGQHGIGSSIAQTEKGIVVLVDHDGPSYLLCVDKSSGKTIWKTDRPKKVAWSSPVVVGSGEKETIVVSSNGTCEAISAGDGKTIWSVDGIKGNTVPSATVAENLIVVGSSEPGQIAAIRRGGSGDVTQTHVAWRSDDATATFCSPLVYQDRVYMVSRAGVAYCLDEQSGRTVWTRRIGQPCWASPLGAANRVYFFGRGGKTTVVAAGEELEILAENDLPTDDRVYGAAAVSSRIVLKTGNRLICVSGE